MGSTVLHMADAAGSAAALLPELAIAAWRATWPDPAASLLISADRGSD